MVFRLRCCFFCASTTNHWRKFEKMPLLVDLARPALLVALAGKECAPPMSVVVAAELGAGDAVSECCDGDLSGTDRVRARGGVVAPILSTSASSS